MSPCGHTKGNARLTRQNDFTFSKIKLVYCLTRKTLKCNSLVQRLCMFDMISSFYLKWPKFARNWEFFSNCESPGTQTKLEQVHNFLWIRSSIKMEEYMECMECMECMESELSGIFLSKTSRQKYSAQVPGDSFYAYDS